MFCPKCGKQNEDSARFCCGCGVVFEDITKPNNPPQYNIPYQPQYQQNGQPSQFRPPVNQQQQYIPPMMHPPQMYRQPPLPGYGLSIASMVLGIISLVLFLVFYISVPCGVVGIVLGSISRSKVKTTGIKNSYATAGIICSAIGIALVVILFIIAIVATLNGNFTNYL